MCVLIVKQAQKCYCMFENVLKKLVLGIKGYIYC